MQAIEKVQIWDNKNRLWQIAQHQLTLQSGGSDPTLSLVFPFAPEQVRKFWQQQQQYFVWVDRQIWRYDAKTANWIAWSSNL